MTALSSAGSVNDDMGGFKVGRRRAHASSVGSPCLRTGYASPTAASLAVSTTRHRGVDPVDRMYNL